MYKFFENTISILFGYEDVYESFKAYRERRNQSRQVFFDEKKQHKFLKALENLGLKSANFLSLRY